MIFSALASLVVVSSVVKGLMSLLSKVEGYVNYAKSLGIFIPLILGVFFFIFIMPKLHKFLPKKGVAIVTLLSATFLVGSAAFGVFFTKKIKGRDPIMGLVKKQEKGQNIRYRDLQKAGIDVNDQADHSLHDLIRKGSPELLRPLSLAVEKANKLAINKVYEGDTPLSLAVRTNNIPALKMLLENPHIDINKKVKVYSDALLVHVIQLFFPSLCTAVDIAHSTGNKEAENIIENFSKKKGIKLERNPFIGL